MIKDSNNIATNNNADTIQVFLLFGRILGYKFIYFGILFSILFPSCSNTKFLAEDEKLYTYTWFSEKGFEKINNKPLKAYELYLVGIVKTNRPVVFLPRTSLSIYNYWKPSGNWGPRHYIYRVFGKPPVLLNNVNPEFRVKVMKQRLADMGHFDSDITYDLKIYGKNNKKARVKYKVFFKSAYTYRNLNFINNNTSVDSLVADAFTSTKIKLGNDYWLKELKDEQIRLAKVLKNKGYYFFNPDDMLFFADTAVGSKQVDLTLVIKDSISEKAYKKYNIDTINIFVNSLRPPSYVKKPNDSLFINNCLYQSIGSPFRPTIITKAISIVPQQKYSLTQHENTLRYLQGLGVFKSVEIYYKEQKGGNEKMNVNINLVPLKPIQTSLEVNFATKSNDFLGPAAIASIGHNNIFRGAEKLVLQVDGGFEWQKRSKQKEYELGLNSYEIGTQLKLIIPRFLTPFKIKNQSRRYVPQTYASIGFRSLKRVRYYRMNLSQTRGGYVWKTSPKREYRIEPVSINYLKLVESSSEFNDFLKLYPQVAKSFDEQLIIGSSFWYTYLSNPKQKQFNQFYYNGILDLSGNLVNSIYKVFNIDEGQKQKDIFGVPYSQYVRVTNDLRYYIYFNEKKQIAMRLLGGIGIPYGNSSVIPFVKQYFAGGSQDLRAFYARSLGPGSYFPPDSLQNSMTIDQSGEIKIMGSIEYRFPITYKTFGAVFIDAGNVWLLNNDPSRPGGKFEFNTFMQDIAVGSGVGIRIDIDYVIIRLDAAVPIRKPYISGSKKWIFNSPGFIKDYIISLAVGYPF